MVTAGLEGRYNGVVGTMAGPIFDFSIASHVKIVHDVCTLDCHACS